MSDRVLIFDADGVFMSERPYWNVALATAFTAAELESSVAGRWDSIADTAFGEIGLQRVTKAVGCNSNWDLACVLTAALESLETRERIGSLLSSDDDARQAMWELRLAASSLFDAARVQGDPLQGFGIARNSGTFLGTVNRFQELYASTDAIGWSFAREQLRESREITQSAFETLRRVGFELRVCTGRHRAEVESPVAALGLSSYFPSASIVSADEVDRAQSLTGQASLGKPHWFSPACAALGFDEAIAPLKARTDESTIRFDVASDERFVYVGDALADFQALQGCRDAGIPISYVHVRSGVTTADQESAIANDPNTLAVISSLGELASVLGGVTA